MGLRLDLVQVLLGGVNIGVTQAPRVAEYATNQSRDVVHCVLHAF